MKRIFVTVLLGLAFIIASAMSAQAAPKGSNLHGEYSLIGTRTCVQVNGGADFLLPNYSVPAYSHDPPVLYAGSTRTTHYKGILKLYGNGLGELSSRVVLMNHNFGFFPTGQYNDECSVTYKGIEDGTILVSIVNCLSENIWPPPLTNTFYSSSSYDLSVTVSSNGDTLLLSDAAMEPEVGTTWTCGWDSGQPDCNQIINPQKRICVRSFTAIRLSPQP